MKKFILIVLSIIVLGLIIRPILVRNICERKAGKALINGASFVIYNQVYRSCLVGWGSKPENIVNLKIY